MPPQGKLFQGGNIQLCLAVYDTRRGQTEGSESDKVLGFYPPRTHAHAQNSIVGLAQAVTVFSSTFNQVGRRRRGGARDPACEQAAYAGVGQTGEGSDCGGWGGAGGGRGAGSSSPSRDAGA